jgi:hypothetical protein
MKLKSKPNEAQAKRLRVEQITPQKPTRKQNDQKEGKQHMQGQQYGCRWLEKRRNTKRKPPKNNVKHKNEQRQRKSLCQRCMPIPWNSFI